MSLSGVDSIYLPGQPIFGSKPSIKQGNGTYSRDGLIRASLLGKVDLARSRVHPPTTSSTVIGHVIRLSPLQATIAISVVDGLALPPGEDFTGVIRTQDVRLTEKDKVKIGDCFRGGDVVRGVVISLGDARSYYITTARNDLGVIFAESEAGASMFPISWQEMRCSKTGSIEKRKCAKPDGL
ncbi:hypothetical protein BU17DRAFT_38520 [Hysterangium stoloniferum]|nr:hypothetical protein BU17DRAFT_38520 [Hysterangium stoloniferum]